MEIEVRKPKTLNLTPETQNVEPWTLKSKPHTIYPICLKKSIQILISLPMIIWSFIFLGTGCTKYLPPFFLSLYLELRHSCLEPQELSPTVRCSPIKVRLVPGLHLLFEWRQVSWYQQHEISFFRSFFLCVCPEAVIQWLRIARIVCVCHGVLPLCFMKVILGNHGPGYLLMATYDIYTHDSESWTVTPCQVSEPSVGFYHLT